MGRRGISTLVALGMLAVTAACGGDDSGPGDALPAVSDGPAVEFRLVYAVTTPEAATTEEYEVRRPFDVHVTLRNHGGDITTERWSSLGAVVTRTAGSSAAGLTVAAAPALSDSRLDRFGAELVAAGHATEGRRHEIGGRSCIDYTLGALMGAVPDGSAPALEDAKPLQAVVDRCVDAQGIVLEERWSTPGGERLLTRRAIELEVGDDLDLDVEAPSATARTAAEGNGTFERVDDDAPPPFAERFSLKPPKAFTHLGRYTVVPPRLQRPDSAAATSLTLTTDVWERGADLLILDQGVGTGGATPFDPATAWRTVTVGPFGEVVLAGDARAAEVRIPRDGGGFVRLAGTLPVDELLELAATIQLAPAAP